MKVLFVSSGNMSGGKPTNLVFAQGQSLINQGVDLTFFTILGKGPLGYLKNIKRLKAVLRANKFDVIHAHYGFCGIVCFFAKKNEKVIISLMGSDLFGEISKTFLSKLKTKVLIFVTQFLSRYMLDFTIVKSDKLGKELWKNTAYKVIPNGVDFSVFFPINKTEARKLLNIPAEKKIVLFPTDVNRMEKNYSLAKKAVELLNDKAVELLQIHGVSQEQLNIFYNAADVMLMTSIYEGSPNVIKENLACNKVIVSTDVGDVRKNFETINGCFITSYDAVDVAQKIKSALLISESNGREKIKWLDSKVIAEQIIGCYKDLKK